MRVCWQIGIEGEDDYPYSKRRKQVVKPNFRAMAPESGGWTDSLGSEAKA